MTRSLRLRLLLVLVIGVTALGARAAPGLPDSRSAPVLTGQRFSYTVKTGDSLTLVSARFGIDLTALADLNGLPSTARLSAGQTLEIDSRHLIPNRSDAAIVINVPQRMLFHRTAGAVRGYPVGLGRPSWPTFVGRFAILSLETDPVWDVPVSIQAEMGRDGKPVLTRVAPGPNNPLGAFWIGLDRPGYGIHGTNAPASIYRFQTHGCIRLHPDDVATVFHALGRGSAGESVYEPILLAQAGDGRIWLEAHPDVYRRAREPLLVAHELAAQAEIDGDIDWEAVRAVLRSKRGTPVDVTHPAVAMVIQR